MKQKFKHKMKIHTKIKTGELKAGSYKELMKTN